MKKIVFSTVLFVLCLSSLVNAKSDVHYRLQAIKEIDKEIAKAFSSGDRGLVKAYDRGRLDYSSCVGIRTNDLVDRKGKNATAEDFGVIRDACFDYAYYETGLLRKITGDNASDVYSLFRTDEKLARDKYEGNSFQIQGEITELKKNYFTHSVRVTFKVNNGEYNGSIIVLQTSANPPPHYSSYEVGDTFSEKLYSDKVVLNDQSLIFHVKKK